MNHCRAPHVRSVRSRQWRCIFSTGHVLLRNKPNVKEIMTECRRCQTWQWAGLTGSPQTAPRGACWAGESTVACRVCV